MTQRATTAEKKIAAFAEQVATRLDSVVGKLQAIAADLPVDADDLTYFSTATRHMLEHRPDGSLAGAGYAVNHVRSGRPPAMVWWVDRGGSVTERDHSVDPESESFYDYAALRWFRAASDSGKPTLSGPFIDTWGSDDYTVTVSLPVVSRSEVEGVVAADFHVRRFIDSLTADLARISTPLALVNESDRVVVSTVPWLSTGLPTLPRGARMSTATSASQRFPVSTYGWSVVLLPR